MKKVTWNKAVSEQNLCDSQSQTPTFKWGQQYERDKQAKQEQILRIFRLLNQSQQQNQRLLSQKLEFQNICKRLNNQLIEMRKRAQTMTIQKVKTMQEIVLELQNTKRDLMMLRNKFQMVQKERDILKQGNSKLINEFMCNGINPSFNTNQVSNTNQSPQQIKFVFQNTKQLQDKLELQRRKNSQLEEQNFNLGQQIQLLKKSIDEVNRQIKNPNNQILKLNSQLSKLNQQKQTLSQQKQKLNLQKQKLNIEKEKLNIEKQKKQKDISDKNIEISQITTNVNESLAIIDELKKQIENKDKIRDELKKQIENKDKLVDEKNILIKDYQKQCQILKIQRTKLQNSFYKAKSETQLLQEGKSQLPGDGQQKSSTIRNNSIVNKNLLTNMDLKMGSSICQTQNLKQSIFYDSSSQFQRPESIVAQTQRIEKKLTKLQKKNNDLQKDYKYSQQKVKTVNREYSKLKLDYLKQKQQFKRKQEDYIRRIEILTNKIQSFNQRGKQNENYVQSIKSEKQRQKSVLKEIIYKLESTGIQNQQKYQKLLLENQGLKQTINAIKVNQQKDSGYTTQLEYEKSKTKMLEKQLQTKTKDFQKCLEQYETMLSDCRKMNANEKSSTYASFPYKLDGSRGVFKTEGSIFSFQNETLLRTFKMEIQQLQDNSRFQNERYNVLQNSNRQLRKQLLKMIQQEEKLRKDLITQKIKNRTNSLSSKNSRTFSSRKLRDDAIQTEKNQEKNLTVSSSSSALNRRLNNLNLKLNTQRHSDSLQVPKESNQNNNKSFQYKGFDIKPSQQKIIQNKYLDADKNKTSYLKTLRQKRFQGMQSNVRQNIPQNQQSNPPKNKQIIKITQNNKDKDQVIQLTNNDLNSKNNYKYNKYQYSPNFFPNLKMVNSYVNEMEQLNEKSQQNMTVSNDNQEITLEISSSKSNFSKRQNLNEIPKIQNPTQDNQRAKSQLKEPQSASKLYSKRAELIQKKQETQPINSFLVGKDQTTRSSGEMRFARRNRTQTSTQKKP